MILLFIFVYFLITVKIAPKIFASSAVVSSPWRHFVVIVSKSLRGESSE